MLEKTRCKAIIFDFDGVIVNTESIQFEAFKIVLKNFGIKISRAIFTDFIGKSTPDNFKSIKKIYNIKTSLKSLVEEKNRIYLSLLNKKRFTLKRGFYRIIDYARNKKFKIAIASSSPGNEIIFILKRLKILNRFDLIVSGDDIKKFKPDPEVYKTALERLNIEPESCLVFEDSASGLESAKRAGIKVLILKTKLTKSHDFEGADAILKGFSLQKFKTLEKTFF